MTLRAALLAPVLSAASSRPIIEEHLPDVLLRPGPSGLLWWQWVAIPSLLVFALLAGALLGLATRRVLGHLAARARATWDDTLVERVARPLAVLWAIAIVTAVLPALEIGAGPEATVDRVLRAATYLSLFWGGFSAVDVAFSAAVAARFARASPSLSGLLPLGRKVAKVVLVSLGIVAILNELGFQVASLLAGLGIGGIALALAAQKTVENLFGSVAIGMDQPFRVGDLVRLDGVIGTVEAIGMRSTRVRTLERTVVTFPNGKLADMRAETFAVRDRIRLFANLGLIRETSAEQLRAVLSGIESALRGHPRILADGVSVRFTEFRDWSLNVEVAAYFESADWDAFTLVRQDMYLEFMRIVGNAGTALALPAQTVHLQKNGPDPRTGPV